MFVKTQVKLLRKKYIENHSSLQILSFLASVDLHGIGIHIQYLPMVYLWYGIHTFVPYAVCTHVINNLLRYTLGSHIYLIHRDTQHFRILYISIMKLHLFRAQLLT